MKRFILSLREKITSRRRSGRVGFALLLALLSALSYGTSLPKLGIYWDDWAFVWTRLAVGYAGLLRHFSFSRPLAGQLHNLAILLTGGDPIRIQLYVQLMRICCTLVFAALLRTLWPGSWIVPFAALLFFSYPGFTMIPIGINFGFSYLLMAMLFVSLLLSIRALRGEGRVWTGMAAAMLLSAVNLFASEYFFLLELIRPVLFWVALSEDRADRGWASERRGRFVRVFRAWLPYAAVFGMGLIYRLFFNRTQTLHYEFNLVARFGIDPIAAVLSYFGSIAADLGKVSVAAWAEVFQFPDPAAVGERTALIYWLTVAGSALATGAFFGLALRPNRGERKSEKRSVSAALTAIAVGLALLLLGGQPFWLTGSHLSLIFPNSRFTLPFLPGMALALAGVAGLIYALGLRRTRIGGALGLLFAAAVFGLATGFHFLNAAEYRRDWTLTKDFFRQLSWRIPALAPNTTIVTNTLPIRFSTDNSLTAPLNWIYADTALPEPGRMGYMMYTNTKRSRTLSDFAPGKRIEQEYLTARFVGNTSDTVSVYYRAPGCVRVLDPEIDIFNQTVGEIDRAGALLTNGARILPEAETKTLDPTIFGAEPAAESWCWYYERADLARQRQDWAAVAELGDAAFAGSDYPNDPIERFPFIEGYAMQGRWGDAAAQSAAALAVTPVMNDPLCALWARIERNAEASDAAGASFAAARAALDCGFLEGTGDDEIGN